MAILNNGPNGPIKGKFGSVFAYELNGQIIIRGPRRRRTSVPTKAELLNRKKVSVMNKFLRMLYPVVKYGYKNLIIDHPTKNTANLAQSHVRKECIEIGENNEPFVNPALFKPFRGPLPIPKNTNMQFIGNQLLINWTVDEDYTDPYIKVNLLLYSMEEHADLKISIANANDGTCSIASSILSFSAGKIHVYIGFLDSYSGLLSDSVYVGAIDTA